MLWIIFLASGLLAMIINWLLPITLILGVIIVTQFCARMIEESQNAVAYGKTLHEELVNMIKENDARGSIKNMSEAITRSTLRIERKLKKSELTLYQQIESRDRLKNRLTEEQFFTIEHMRGWAISPDTADFLYTLTANDKPKNIVEMGSGVSSLVFAAALKNNGLTGHIYSLEHEPEYAQKTREMIKEAKLSDYVTVIDAPIEEVDVNGEFRLWFGSSSLKKIPDKVDVIFVDSPPGGLQSESRYPALPLLHKKLSGRATIILDDYDREDEKEIVEKWLNSYPEFTLQKLFSDHGTAVLKTNSNIRQDRSARV